VVVSDKEKVRQQADQVSVKELNKLEPPVVLRILNK
jgi:hypothetical protein